MVKKTSLYIILVSIIFLAKLQAQEIYHGSTTKSFDLIHTKLSLTPDWSKKQLIGNANLTLKPWFYDSDRLELDAKSFEIIEIVLNNKPLAFDYNGLKINIVLDKMYTNTDTLNLQIRYIAKPEELKNIPNYQLPYKGLYFINANNEDPSKPRQMWTQGETSYNSCWFPTIDTPNQKHTQEISITVENSLNTLSNGVLTNTTINDNGTRTDTWLQNQKHSVYLSMVAIGTFKKVIDPNFKDFEVSYYVEPAFEQYALPIFGRTPEMIRFFENLLGVKYPWKKYAQIAVRDYISGAMENTTATVHGSSVQKNPHQLIDETDDNTIAHELFHHWFGDLVTCESWANLPLNESFANYSEYLWEEYKYGNEIALINQIHAREQYFAESQEKNVNLIRYQYASEEDMFDSHSYAKGGRILHMLRKQVGDKAFFAALKDYLFHNQFENTELSDLRKSFEKITGEDLNWFFNQWFLQPGHPRLDISTSVKKDKIVISINQKIDSVNSQVYKIPLSLEYLNQNAQIVNKTFWIDKISQEFIIEEDKLPSYLAFNPELDLLAEIQYIQNQKELISQFEKSPSTAARLAAISSLLKEDDTESELTTSKIANSDIRQIALLALKDKSWIIRELTAQKFIDYDGEDFLTVEKSLQSVIRIDSKPQVRAAAILAMKNFLNPQNDLLFRKVLADTSYLVRSAGLEAILLNNPPDADSLVENFRNISDVNLFAVTANYLSSKGNPADFEWFKQNIKKYEGIELYQVLGTLGAFLVSTDVATQINGISFVRDIALHNDLWFVRLAATQSISLLSGIYEADQALKEIKADEKDQRLINIYSSMLAP